MKALFTLSLLLFLGTSFGQNNTQEYVLTIYATDSLSGSPADVETVYIIEDGTRDYFTVQQSDVGVIAVQLAPGQYTINFKHVDGRRESINVDVMEDTTANVVFSPATN